MRRMHYLFSAYSAENHEEKCCETLLLDCYVVCCCWPCGILRLRCDVPEVLLQPCRQRVLERDLSHAAIRKMSNLLPLLLSLWRASGGFLALNVEAHR